MTTSPATPLTIHAPDHLSPQDCARVASFIAAGELAVLPTDTVYGIGALAADAHAVERLLAAKGRGRQMPPPVLLPSIEAMSDIALTVPDVAWRLAHAFWPGALTLILPARPDLGWDLGDTNGTIALRMPDHPATLTLLNATGPMAVTSANTTGHPPATTIGEAQAYFDNRVAAYIDGGESREGTASTIVHVADGQPRVIRLGALSLEELTTAAGQPITVA